MLLESMFNRYSGSLFFVVSLLLASAVGGETQKVCDNSRNEAITQ